jgi:hypothetical protein
MTLLKRTDWEFLAPLALKEAMSIINKHGAFNGQIGLTHRPGTPEGDKLIDATGSLYDYDSGQFVAKESDFTEFNSAFVGTYLHEIYSTIGNIGRMRIMIMDGPTAYTIHRDVTTRYHLALKTNPFCFFVFPNQNEQMHIPQDNSIYEVDTREYHTFLNGTRATRIHLVMDNLLSYE